jgi:hypothetical protein
MFVIHKTSMMVIEMAAFLGGWITLEEEAKGYGAFWC